MYPPDMITFHCPSCRMKLQVPAKMAGVTGPCPECSATITAPPSTPVPLPVSEPVPSPVPEPAQRQESIPQRQERTPVPAPVAKAPNPFAENNPSPGERVAGRAPAATPVNREQVLVRQHENRPKRRARWMGIVIPLTFILLAIALVLVLLQVFGLVEVWNFRTQKDEVKSVPDTTIRESTPQSSEKKDTPAAPVKPKKDDSASTPAPTPESAPAPETESAVPSGKPSDVPGIKEDTQPEGAFPELPKLPPASSEQAGTSSKPSPPPPPEIATGSEDGSQPQASSLVKQVLEQFLEAKTLDERLPLMTRSVHTREELMASCLARPLKAVKFINMSETVPRLEDNMLQYLYFVSFKDENEDQQMQRIVVMVVERPGTHPPRVHGDAFIEHYEKKFEQYAKHPNKKVTTFHCIAEARTASLSKDLPDDLKDRMMRFVIKTHPNAEPAFNAYLSKSSPLMESIGPRKDFPLTVPRFCVLSFRWNTKDPARPYIELTDIIRQGWEK